MTPTLLEENAPKPDTRMLSASLFAASWHNGWQPDREDVADLTALTFVTITAEEYQQRIRNRVQPGGTTRRQADEAQPMEVD